MSEYCKYVITYNWFSFVGKEIVNELLGKYNKKLDKDQMNALLSKESSENPLWLAIACEELRVFGRFREISDKINQLADGLLELAFHFN